MPDSTESELLALSQQLLDSIDQQDWQTYTRLCDPTLTAFEPEAVGHLVAGMAFHEFYFQLESTGRPKQSTIASPNGSNSVATRLRSSLVVISPCSANSSRTVDASL